MTQEKILRTQNISIDVYMALYTWLRTSHELDVAPEHKEMIEQLIESNADIFASSDLELGRTETVKMKIDAGDHRDSINAPPYQYKTSPFLHRNV